MYVDSSFFYFMSKIQKLVAGIAAAIIVFLGGSQLGGTINYSAVSSFATSSAITIASSDTLVQATTTRTYYRFTNDCNSAVFLAFNGDNAAVARKGITIYASSTYEISTELASAYSGAIHAISPGGNCILTVSGY